MCVNGQEANHRKQRFPLKYQDETSFFTQFAAETFFSGRREQMDYPETFYRGHSYNQQKWAVFCCKTIAEIGRKDLKGEYKIINSGKWQRKEAGFK